MVLWGELRVEATLENLRKVSEFVRDIGQQLQGPRLRLSFDALRTPCYAPRAPETQAFVRRVRPVNPVPIQPGKEKIRIVLAGFRKADRTKCLRVWRQPC